MLDPVSFLAALREQGVRFFTGVPDSLLKEFCACVADQSAPGEHVIAANEGAAIGLAAGHYLGSASLGLVYLQNSGLGNTVNPLLSLADPEVYGLPMLLLIGWRGEPGIHDEPQHVKQGRVLLGMLEAMEVPFRILSAKPDEGPRDLAKIVSLARERERPVAVVVRKGTFSSYAGARRPPVPELAMSRERAIETVISQLTPSDVVVGSTGMISRELFEIRVRRGGLPGRDFLTVGSMGHASSIALGVALRRTDRQIFCLEGDGAMLMHLGSVAVGGQCAPPNFKHVVLNNGCHDSVGGQPTVAFAVPLAELAKVSGYAVVGSVATEKELVSAVCELRATRGPAFLEVRVRSGARPDLGRPTSPAAENKKSFMLGLDQPPR